jgi:hypothetical protein
MRTLLLVLLALGPFASGDSQAEVWRCKEGDRTVFSDNP